MKYLRLLPLAACCLIVSCGSTPTPLVSKPPVKALRVTGFTFGDGVILKKFTFPSAIYTATMEDEDTYYYAPPGGEVAVWDTGMKYTQGAGLYIEKESESAKPNGFYLRSPIGRLVQMGKEDIRTVPIK